MAFYNHGTVIHTLAALAVAAPASAFLALAVAWLLGLHPRERVVKWLTAVVYLITTAAVAALFVLMERGGLQHSTVVLGDWFSVGHYEFSLTLVADRLSLPLLALTAVLLGVIGSFSVRYLHRDRGYLRFFLLLHLFGFGSMLVFSAGSLDLLIAGWELVGLTSVLLIAFFQERKEPVQNAMRVFGIYRITDIGLLLGVFVLHHVAGSTSSSSLFRGEWPVQQTALSSGAATVAAFLFLLAAAGKSAQIPFSGWLPRAMEGPTPSSAIFYGAISVHMGVYLMLRVGPLLDASPGIRVITVVLGVLTAIHATMSGRAATDAKTSLAYAALAQVGLIFAEAGMGWSWLALLHMVSHAAVRTLQFLRAPSMLHDYHRVHAAAGGHFPKTGAHYEALLHAPARAWLYRLALDRGHLDAVLDRLVTGPILRAAETLARFEAGDNGKRQEEVRRAPRHVDALTSEVVGGLDG